MAKIISITPTLFVSGKDAVFFLFSFLVSSVALFVALSWGDFLLILDWLDILIIALLLFVSNFLLFMPKIRKRFETIQSY